MQQQPEQQQTLRQIVAAVLDRLLVMLQQMTARLVTALITVTTWAIVFPRFFELLLLVVGLYVWAGSLLWTPGLLASSRSYAPMLAAVSGWSAPPNEVWAGFFVAACLPDMLGLLAMAPPLERVTIRHRLIGYVLRIVGLAAMFLVLGWVSDLIGRANPGSTGSKIYAVVAGVAGISFFAILLLTARELARLRNITAPKYRHAIRDH